MAVQFVEVCLEPVIVKAVAFAVDFVQLGKHRVAIAEIGLLVSSVLLQYIVKFVDINLRYVE